MISIQDGKLPPLTQPLPSVAPHATFLAMSDEICRGKTRTISLPSFVFPNGLFTLCLPLKELSQFGIDTQPVSPFDTPFSGHQPPQIGVCIPAKNVEKYLPAALESLGCQTYIPDEVMFIDDNSTDNTAAIAQKSGVITQFIKGPNRWASGARNKGISLMQSDVIVLLDADDLLEP